MVKTENKNSGFHCPYCGNGTVFPLIDTSEEFMRGNTHYCISCKKILLIMVE